MKKEKSYTIWLIVAAAIFFVLHRYLGANFFLTLLIIAVIGGSLRSYWSFQKKADNKCQGTDPGLK
jgi:hypothetical protein